MWPRGLHGILSAVKTIIYIYTDTASAIVINTRQIDYLVYLEQLTIVKSWNLSQPTVQLVRMILFPVRTDCLNPGLGRFY